MKSIFTKTRAVMVILLLAVLTVFALPQKTGAAASAEDEILYYGIEAKVLETGSVQFVYTIDWKVLKSSNGGVTWVKIGIPNSNAEKFYSLTNDTISFVKYYSEGGIYARVDFKREYMAGEVIHFSFGFTQHNLFKEPVSKNPGVAMNALSEQDAWNTLYIYDFVPGWFPSIAVDKYEIKWDASKVAKCSELQYGSYYYKTGSLKPNQMAFFRVGYYPGTYSFTHKTVAHFGSLLEPVMYVLLCIGMVIFLVFIKYEYGDTYFDHGGGHYHGHFGGGGGGCACACACACAGGGRAGCSKKDFYGTKVSSKRLRKVLRSGAKDAESETL